MTNFTKPGLKKPGLYSFITLGCKSNQYDTAAMAGDLRKAGLAEGPVEEADYLIVNTCMVTGPTEAQCRKAIRQARRSNPKAVLVAAGCMATGARKQLEFMSETDLIIEPAQKSLLSALLGLEASGLWKDWPDDPAVVPGARNRGFLKIQDGCDAACTYCIVPSVRGGSRSLEPDNVLESIRRLAESGLREVVLSGIHLGQYGADLRPVCGLEDLLEKYLQGSPPGRLRLSSIEPLEVTPRLIETLSGAGTRICRHLHIPLQSGSDRILKAMARPYTRDQYIQAVSDLRASVPDAAVGCDVICGFPGESEEDFKRTQDLVERLEIPFIHAFPYSPRRGTRASLLADDVPHGVKKERVKRMGEVALKNRIRFAGTFIGGQLQVALEKSEGPRGGRMGLAGNYLRVEVLERKPVRESALIPGDIVEASIQAREGDILLAVHGEPS